MGQDEVCWRQMLVAFGIPTVLIADDPELLATASAAYCEWMVDMPAAEPEIEIRLATESAPSIRVGCGIAVKGSRLTLRGTDFEAHADAHAKSASCVVPRRLLGDPEALAAEVTDTLLLFLLARSGRTPVHAAGIVVGDTALVLLGPSGSGKSTLALEASRRGLGVLSDDTLYIQLNPRLRIWGLRRPIHVFPQDAPSGSHETRVRNGVRKAVIPVSPDHSALVYADSAVPILLAPGEQVGLARLGQQAARAAMPALEPGFDLLPEESAAAVDALLKHGAWRLTLARDPGAAIDCLLRRFRSAADNG